MQGDGEAAENFGYTAFEKWQYKQMIYVVEDTQAKTWIDMGQSFYHASHCLVKGIVDSSLMEDIEGIAAIYLFRHYLELALKTIILTGRSLKEDGAIVPRDEVRSPANIHDLGELWRSVLANAQPKMGKDDWNNYDIAFVEQCVMEFDSVDKKGFAFRYSGQGGERCSVDFSIMLFQMEHVYQVLEGIITYLVETHHQTLEWLSELRSQAGW